MNKSKRNNLNNIFVKKSLYFSLEEWKVIQQLLLSEKESDDMGNWEDETDYHNDQLMLSLMIEKIETLFD